MTYKTRLNLQTAMVVATVVLFFGGIIWLVNESTNELRAKRYTINCYAGDKEVFSTDNARSIRTYDEEITFFVGDKFYDMTTKCTIKEN